MSEHLSSKARRLAVEHEKTVEKRTYIDRMNDKFVMSTTKVFNTVYSLSKRNCPFSDIESEIELQVKYGLNIGIGLHFRHSAA